MALRPVGPCAHATGLLLAVYPPQVAQGKGWKAYRPQPRPAKASPTPYARSVTFTAHRDALSGRFCAKPQPGPARALLARPRPSADLRLTRHLIEWPEDGQREVMKVSVKMLSARRAQLRGEVSASSLRAFEAGLADDELNMANPRRHAEWELEQMHSAHRTDKGRRAAVSKKRNAQARAAQEAQTGARSMPPAPQVSAAVSVSTAGLLAALAALDPDGLGRVTFRVRKEAGKPASIELTTPTGLASYPL